MEKKDTKSTALIVVLSIILIALLVGTCMVTWMYKNGEQNSVIIYFSNKEYSSPTIEYRLDKKEWDSKDLEANTEKKNYSHKVIIPLGDSTQMIGKFKD